MGKSPPGELVNNDPDFDQEDFDEDEDDILFDDEKYLSRRRRDSKTSKPLPRCPRPRRSSLGSSELKATVVKQPSPPVDELPLPEVKPRKQRSNSIDEVDIDSELSSLIKDLKIGAEDEGSEIPKIPLYFGWFFGPTASDSLAKLSEVKLKECLEIPDFQEWIDNIGFGEKVGRDVASYYKNCLKSPLHVTAKFTGRVEHKSIYAGNARLNVGKDFNLAIVGFFFTEKSYGFRVKLTEEQYKLFGEEPGRGQLLTRRNSSPMTSLEQTGHRQQEKKSKASSGVIPHGDKKLAKEFPGLNFVLQKENFQPTDTRAHITIGTRLNVPAKHTGDDLLDIINLEQQYSTPSNGYKVPSGTLRKFRRGRESAFVLYPKTRIYVKGIFMPYF